jgi:polyphosphate kinase 2
MSDKQHLSKHEYKQHLHQLQVELVKLQRDLIRHEQKVLVIFEGRDAAGKDGTIKRIVQHLSPRETRVVALGVPSDHDRRSWYFQRFVSHLPPSQEMVLFNRSWYNRAGVERVMGFCSEAEYEDFLHTAPRLEQMLVNSGIQLFKYYLDISKGEQKRRLADRRHDPLKQWKVSPIDAQALKRWQDYSEARNTMFARTHSPLAPWTIVCADDKRSTRIHLICDLLSRLEYDGKEEAVVRPDPNQVFDFDESYLRSGLITH